MPAPSMVLPNATPVILAFGDSLTEGYGLERGESFAAQLEALLQDSHGGATVLNAGISGDTTADAVARLPRLLSGLNVRPDLAIVEFGANDVFRGVPIERIRANLELIVVELGRCGIPVLLAKMEAPPIFGAFGQACTALYDDIARRYAVPLFPFFPAGVLANPALCLRDRIHPNARGAAAIARGARPAVEAALARLAAAPMD